MIALGLPACATVATAVPTRTATYTIKEDERRFQLTQQRTGDRLGLASLRDGVDSCADPNRHRHEVAGFVNGDQHTRPQRRRGVEDHVRVLAAQRRGRFRAADEDGEQRGQREGGEQLPVAVVGGECDEAFAGVEQALRGAHEVQAGRVFVVVAAQVAEQACIPAESLIK